MTVTHFHRLFKTVPRKSKAGASGGNQAQALSEWLDRVCAGFSCCQTPGRQLGTAACSLRGWVLFTGVMPTLERGYFTMASPTILSISQTLLAELIMRMVSHFIFIPHLLCGSSYVHVLYRSRCFLSFKCSVCVLCPLTFGNLNIFLINFVSFG